MSRPLISASGLPGFDALVADLADMAQALAEAGAQNRRLARGADPLRWRRPGLLWPLFSAPLTKG